MIAERAEIFVGAQLGGDFEIRSERGALYGHDQIDRALLVQILQRLVLVEAVEGVQRHLAPLAIDAHYRVVQPGLLATCKAFSTVLPLVVIRGL